MIELVIDARCRDLGGFEVGRVLPYAKRRMVGPFVFFDHMGPVVFPPDIPRTTDVRPHPHIGLSTVTYLFTGELMHRDSLGSEQPIRPGEVNWMTAGRGISHSERFEAMRGRGGVFDGIQAWLALPEAHEEDEPSFVHFAGDTLPAGETDGVRVRVIAGAAYGLASRVPIHSPLCYAHLELEAGARTDLPQDLAERAVYVARGRIELGGSQHRAGRMIVLRPRSAAVVAALEPSTVMLLGGEPLGERYIWWNFVSSRRERIEQAKEDWRARRIPLPAGDDREFIPLPGEPQPPAEPMS